MFRQCSFSPLLFCQPKQPPPSYAHVFTSHGIRLCHFVDLYKNKPTVRFSVTMILRAGSHRHYRWHIYHHSFGILFLEWFIRNKWTKQRVCRLYLTTTYNITNCLKEYWNIYELRYRYAAPPPASWLLLATTGNSLPLLSSSLLQNLASETRPHQPCIFILTLYTKDTDYYKLWGKKLFCLLLLFDIHT